MSPPARIVVSRRNAGLGDCLISLSCAWHYAKRTRRTLVIDWRWSRYRRDSRENAFPLFFEPPREIGGVPVIADESVATLRYPRPIHSRHRGLVRLPLRLAATTLALHTSIVPGYANALADELAVLQTNPDVPEPTVLLRCFVGNTPHSRADHHAVLRHLRPREEIRREIDAYAAAHLTGRKVVAVHVRHGNGGDLMHYAAHWKDEAQVLAEIHGRIERARRALGSDAVVFLCTDSPAVEAALRARVPDLLTRDKRFRAAGAGSLHDGRILAEPDGESVGRDALVEMILLSLADAFVGHPPYSLFSFYARSCGEAAVF